MQIRLLILIFLSYIGVIAIKIARKKQIEDQAKSHGIARDAVIRDVFLKNQPTKRFATVEEMGALAVFLSSDAAASITGTALPVDGGWTAH